MKKLFTGFSALLTWMFISWAIWNAYHVSKKIHFNEIKKAFASIEVLSIFLASLFVFIAYYSLTLYDQLAFVQLKKNFSPKEAHLTSFIGHAFNLNLGALMGGFPIRLRIFSRLGLSTKQIAELVIFIIITNWVGFSTLLGSLLLFGPYPISPLIPASSFLQRFVGAFILLLALSYILICELISGKTFKLAGHTIGIPSFKMALKQIGVSLFFWPLPSLILFTVLPSHLTLSYIQILSIHMLSAVAGLIIHVPAGFGVLEGILLKSLGNFGQHPEVSAAILAGTALYRILYYFVPLFMAIIMLAFQELKTTIRSSS